MNIFELINHIEFRPMTSWCDVMHAMNSTHIVVLMQSFPLSIPRVVLLLCVCIPSIEVFSNFCVSHLRSSSPALVELPSLFLCIMFPPEFKRDTKHILGVIVRSLFYAFLLLYTYWYFPWFTIIAVFIYHKFHCFQKVLTKFKGNCGVLFLKRLLLKLDYCQWSFIKSSSVVNIIHPIFVLKEI